jgi:hypothetical protein
MEEENRKSIKDKESQSAACQEAVMKLLLADKKAERF